MMICIKSFLIFIFSEKDSYLRIGSKRRRIVLSVFLYIILPGALCTQNASLLSCAANAHLYDILDTGVRKQGSFRSFSPYSEALYSAYRAITGIIRTRCDFPRKINPPAVSAACQEYTTQSRQERKVSTVDRVDDDVDADVDDDSDTREKKRASTVHDRRTYEIDLIFRSHASFRHFPFALVSMVFAHRVYRR